MNFEEFMKRSEEGDAAYEEREKQREETSQQVDKWLADLGDSPDAIAEALRAKGIKGVREDGNHCALACYITRRLEFPVGEIEVDEENWGSVTADEDGELLGGNLSTACRRFIQQFDEGGFPDLEKEERK